MSKTITLLLLLLLVAVPSPPPSTAAVEAEAAMGLDAFLSAEARRDPSGSNDSFPNLPSALKRSLAASSHQLDFVSFLLSLQIPVPVYVKLVGAQDGSGGGGFSSSAPSLLQSLVNAAQSSGRFQVVGEDPHHLAVYHSLHLDVSLSLSSLGLKIAAALSSHIAAAPSPFYPSALLSVSFSTVDRIIEEEFRREDANSAPGFYIYLLNLGPQTKPYAYTDDVRDSSPAFSKCYGTLWAGKERYLWIDLAAGPVNYGPAISGEGLIPPGEFHPLASLRGRPKSERALLSVLASLVLSAYQTLLVPSLRIPVYHDRSLLIQFIHFHGSEVDSAGLDWESIKQTLKESELAYKWQTLVFKSYSVKYSDCSICTFAIARSTNFYTSRFLFENHTLIVSEYLDSKRLHQILSDSVEQFGRVATIPEEYNGRVLPVYVFDLDYNKPLLLDRHHQAVAFRDMVIAVRTRSLQGLSDYSCNGRHVIAQIRNLDRPIISSVLQSMWGVSPTHLSWSPWHNSTLVDYTWSIGQTPFGPFTQSSSLSFVQRDAARRNVLLTTLNYTITSAIEVWQAVAVHGGEKKLLKKNNHTEFIQRRNLFKYKLEKVISAMSQLDFEKAIFFMSSSHHDLYAIHTLVYEATQQLEASLVCFQDPPFPWASVSLYGIFVIGSFYVFTKRNKILRSKRKQF